MSPEDSVLGSDVDTTGRGIKDSYADLIKSAFQPQWWDSNAKVDGSDYDLMEFNFSLYWGLAIQAYESTLVSDETPVDRFFRGDTNGADPGGRPRPGHLPGQGRLHRVPPRPGDDERDHARDRGRRPAGGENGTESTSSAA